MLTAWIPFQDTPEEMGPVAYIDRSNHWPGAAQMRTFHAKDLADLETRFMEGKGEVVKLPMALRKGQVSFHSCLLAHGSQANLGTRPRIAMALHFQDASNRFRHQLDDNGKPWHLFNDDLARKLPDGTPDYTDPDVFPVIWSNGTD
jgi:ectoine hydroxylase-related dioxygenase (phytanoyl-CoA dioxygenase family)